MKITTSHTTKRCINVSTVVDTATKSKAGVTAIDTIVGSVSRTISARHVAASKYSPYKIDHKSREPSFCRVTLYKQHWIMEDTKDFSVKVPGSVTTKPSTLEQHEVSSSSFPPVRESKLIKISERKFVSIRSYGGEPRVNIRQYIHDSHGRPYSTKRGILLTPTEWQQLKNNLKDIDTCLKERMKWMWPCTELLWMYYVLFHEMFK